MNEIWLYIKKFFAMLFSIVFGVFKGDKNNNHIETESNRENIHKNTRPRKKEVTPRILQEDEESEKSRSSFGKDNKEQEEIIYYAKRDIQRLLFIKNNVLKIEQEIEKCENLEDVYNLEKELKKAKDHFDKIAKHYENINLDVPIINDIKNIVKETDGLIKKNEKSTEKKIFNLKKVEQEEEEKKEEIQEENIDKKEEQVSIRKAVEQKEQETEKESNNKKEVSKEIEIKELDEVIYREEEEELEEVKITEPKKVEISKEDKVREIVINMSVLKASIDSMKNERDSRRLAEVAAILARARALAASSNPSMLLQINPVVAVSSTLHVNNEVRRARSLTGMRVAKLKLDKVMRAVGLNPAMQVRFIMTNSLKEIRKLKSKLRTYGNIPEVVAALNELNELEMEIMLQAQELQNQNNMQQTHHR